MINDPKIELPTPSPVAPLATCCPICAITMEMRFTRVADSDSRDFFSIVGCPKCGLGMTYPMPKNVDDYYHGNYHGGRHGFTASFCDWRRLRLVRAQTQWVENRRLLDIGCGDGTFLLRSKLAGWSVLGVERNPDHARGIGLDVRTSLDDVEGTFGCITLWHVLEHIENLTAMAARLQELLDPNGVIVISVPDARSLQARLFGSQWLHLDVPRHAYHFNQQSLTLLLHVQGLSVSRLPRTELEYDLMGWVQSLLNCLLREPNVLFKILTKRRTSSGHFYNAMIILIGTVISGLALVPSWLSGLLGRGGTLIAVARREVSRIKVATTIACKD